MHYNFKEIEEKWQSYWAKNQTFKATNGSDKPKYYVLDMFPYPSGAGLHVGHPLGYIASDIYARYKRHKGYNVLHPQGYDSFGLPAEQYAIQTGQHPAKTTEENIKTYRRQLDQIGFSFDWSREVRTSNPRYYKWTQWIFIQLFNSWYNKDTDRAEDISTLISIFKKEGNLCVNASCDEDIKEFTSEQWEAFSKKEQEEILLQYRLTFLSDTEVNWCPQLGTVLANDEIINGVSERGGHPVVRKKMTQWSMRISAYAQRLLDGLKSIDWPQPLKDSQTNWIGRSQGAMVSFKIDGHDGMIDVFTTRPDTIFGVSFMTLAPEHELVSKITTSAQKTEVKNYISATAKRSERERMADVKTISGVFTGAYAIHPFSGEKVQIWIGDYVLAGYGTGAVMAVPCGDQRDYDFAKHFKIPIPNIFEGVDISEQAHTDKEGTIIANSDFLSGLSYKKALKLSIYELEKQEIGHGKVNYRLRDAVFSRQRYWGEPFPVYYVDGMPQIIDETHLPIVLPEVEKYLPTEDGQPPLGNADTWAWDSVNNKVVGNDEINNTSVWPLELNTMPGWAGSSWYFYRYMDTQNSNTFVSDEAKNYWQDVDLYLGGSEHATGHLLYSRFWQKFLFDLNLLPVDEYAKKLINQGMILGTSAFIYRKPGTQIYVSKDLLKSDINYEPIRVDVNLINASDELNVECLKKWQPQFEKAEFEFSDGIIKVGREVEKMSKSKYNVVNPDEICEQYGADTLRMYEMFLGPLEQAKPWNTAGMSGVHNFLRKFWKLFYENDSLIVTDAVPDKKALKVLHETIKKITEDIESFSFNTCVSSFMICVNELTSLNCHSIEILKPLTVLLSPFAPHLSEELWEKLGHTESIVEAPFPVFNEAFLVEDEKNYPVSFNGKMRFTLSLSLALDKEAIQQAVLDDPRTTEYLDGKAPKKWIVVPNKIINIVF